jgi:hypothetical protein
MRERGLRGEVDLLLRQLGTNVGVDEVVSPRQQATGDDQDDDNHCAPVLVMMSKILRDIAALYEWLETYKQT